jgi:hypothetical protein
MLKKQATQLYEKVGRSYKPWGNAHYWTHDADVMKAGTFLMIYCSGAGAYRYTYGVTPDNASFAAAAELAIDAMVAEMQARAIAAPQLGIQPYTKRQLAIIERFRAEMAATGAFLPTHWMQASARDIAEAGADAVSKFAKGEQP